MRGRLSREGGWGSKSKQESIHTQTSSTISSRLAAGHCAHLPDCELSKQQIILRGGGEAVRR